MNVFDRLEEIEFDLVAAEFALENEVSVGDVRCMIELGLVLIACTPTGFRIVPEDGLSKEEFKAAWRVLQRIKRK